MIFLKQKFFDKNFMAFTGLHVIQVFHCHFNSNFFPLILSTLLGHRVSRSSQSLLLGFSFTLPHLNNSILSSFVVKYGSYRVIRILLGMKVLLPACMYFIGSDSTVMLCIYISSNRIFTEGICRLLGLVISTLVDEDQVIHQRSWCMPALIFGTAALFAKPGQSVAPIVGNWLRSDGAMESLHSRDDVFFLVIFVPLICGLVQLHLWSQFTLHGPALNRIQQLCSARLAGFSLANKKYNI